jgi:DNA-directed RNA polymerase subunit RPC12/RpoP
MPEVIATFIWNYRGLEKNISRGWRPGCALEPLRRRQERLWGRLKSSVEYFRHNLSPVEVKTFLTTVKDLTENLCILYCIKVPVSCPKCGREVICQSGAVNLYSSNSNKITHEIIACLRCGHKKLSTLLTIERM